MTYAEILGAVEQQVATRAPSDVLYPNILAAEAKIRPFQYVSHVETEGFRKKPVYDITIAFKAGDKAVLRMGKTKRTDALLALGDALRKAEGWLTVGKLPLDDTGTRYTWALQSA
jgi:hypothetical protein